MTQRSTRPPRSRYLSALWLLSSRDLKVRYSTSLLGYFWSVLDPLVMSLIYWFVFTQVFERAGVGEQPYIVFLVAGLLPWVWFNISVSDFTRAFKKDAKLVRSTAIPREIWIMRIIISKGAEFLFSLPVLVAVAILFGATVSWHLLLFPVAIVMQALLLLGLGLLIAPLCVLYSDLERTTKLILRALFYATPIIYGIGDLPDGFDFLGWVNPLAGIFTLYRVGLFPGEWDGISVLSSALVIGLLLIAGTLMFRRLERTVLKEL